LKHTNLAPLISNPRLLRSISETDAIGMIAFEDLMKEWHNTADPDQTGVFIGAQCPNARDQNEYLNPFKTVNFSTAEFGKAFHIAHPMTLLRGLTNNVNCYTSVALNARGSNANYLNMELSGHVAVSKAARSITEGTNRTAIAGAFSSLASDDPFIAMMEYQGFFRRDGVFEPFQSNSTTTAFADGSIFLALGEADNTGTEIIASEMAHDLSGPTLAPLDAELLAEVIRSTLAAAQISASDVGGVFLAGHGVARTDYAEQQAVDIVFVESKPAVYCSSPFFGNLGESGGMIDFALASSIYSDEQIERNLRVNSAYALNPSKRHVILVRVTLWGELSCILLKVN
jgi:3-oxoacyl-(acyl-carrier-protein) synthase